MDRSFTKKTPVTEEIEQMLDTPRCGFHHRKAHSDLDELLLFDPSNIDLSCLPPPATITAIPNVDCAIRVMTSNVSHEKNENPNVVKSPKGHHRSFSIGFDGMYLKEVLKTSHEELNGNSSGEKVLGHHMHNFSMDGTSYPKSSMKMKGMTHQELAELVRNDPKRAKRLLANRESAARSKQKKILHKNELETKLKTLRDEAATLSIHINELQKEATGLTAENKELKLRVQAKEQEQQLQDAENEAVMEEIKRLKLTTAQILAVKGPPPQFSSIQSALQHFEGLPPELISSIESTLQQLRLFRLPLRPNDTEASSSNTTCLPSTGQNTHPDFMKYQTDHPPY